MKHEIRNRYTQEPFIDLCIAVSCVFSAHLKFFKINEVYHIFKYSGAHVRTYIRVHVSQVHFVKFKIVQICTLHESWYNHRALFSHKTLDIVCTRNSFLFTFIIILLYNFSINYMIIIYDHYSYYHYLLSSSLFIIIYQH